MASKAASGRPDSTEVGSPAPSGRNSRSHEVPGWAFTSRWTAWKPRFAIPTRSTFG